MKSWQSSGDLHANIVIQFFFLNSKGQNHFAWEALTLRNGLVRIITETLIYQLVDVDNFSVNYEYFLVILGTSLVILIFKLFGL